MDPPSTAAKPTPPARAEKHYAAAVVGYTQAIEARPKHAIYWANRAAAHIRLEEYGSAIADASQAIEVDPDYIKVRRRRCGRGESRAWSGAGCPPLREQARRPCAARGQHARAHTRQPTQQPGQGALTLARCARPVRARGAAGRRTTAGATPTLRWASSRTRSRTYARCVWVCGGAWIADSRFLFAWVGRVETCLVRKMGRWRSTSGALARLAASPLRQPQVIRPHAPRAQKLCSPAHTSTHEKILTQFPQSAAHVPIHPVPWTHAHIEMHMHPARPSPRKGGQARAARPGPARQAGRVREGGQAHPL